MMARKITRRGLIGLGLSLGAMATLYPFLRWGYEISQQYTQRHATARGVWFEKIGEAPSDGEVELRFVDEAGTRRSFRRFSSGSRQARPRRSTYGEG